MAKITIKALSGIIAALFIQSGGMSNGWDDVFEGLTSINDIDTNSWVFCTAV